MNPTIFYILMATLLIIYLFLLWYLSRKYKRQLRTLERMLTEKTTAANIYENKVTELQKQLDSIAIPKRNASGKFVDKNGNFKPKKKPGSRP